MKILRAYTIYLLVLSLIPDVSANAEILHATKVLVRKADRTMSLFHDNELLRTYTITLGRSPLGAKQKQSDGKTPEGSYLVDGRNNASKFHRSLHISYPNQHDREHARQGNFNPGGDIMIHGMKNGFGWLGQLHRLFDWTDGCIAVTDSEMDEVWELVPIGTPIEIIP